MNIQANDALRRHWALIAAQVLACAALLLLFWPQVNLEVTDKTGADSLPLLGPTKLTRIGRFLLLSMVTTAMTWRLFQARPRAWLDRPRGASALLVGVAGATALAVLPAPVNGANLFLAAEFVVCTLAVLAVYQVWRLHADHETMAQRIHQVLVVTFALLLLVMFIVFLIEPTMAYREKLRGWRLGGSIIGANTLAMIGLIAGVSGYALLCQGRKRVQTRGWRMLGAVMLVAGPTCLLMTRTRSLVVLMLVTAVLVDLARRVERPRWRWAPIALAGALALLVATAPLLRTDRLLRSLVGGVAMVDGLEGIVGGETDTSATTASTVDMTSTGASMAPDSSSNASGFGTIRDRITVYRHCLDHLGDYWLLGAGYVEGGERFLVGVFADNRKVPWEPPHPHNIVFDVLLTRGVLLGAPLIMALVLACIYAAVRIVRPRVGEPMLNLLGVQAAVLFGGSLGNFSIAGQVRPLLTAFWLFALVLLIDAARAPRRSAAPAPMILPRPLSVDGGASGEPWARDCGSISMKNTSPRLAKEHA